jgi:hypothetical protein
MRQQPRLAVDPIKQAGAQQAGAALQNAQMVNRRQQLLALLQAKGAQQRPAQQSQMSPQQQMTQRAQIPIAQQMRNR